MSTSGQTAAGVTIPDTKLARDATDLVRDSTTDLVYNHSRRVWTAIALHTTPGIPEFMEPEVALVTAGVEYDVLGIGYHDVSDADRAEITALHPRPNFKRSILQAFTEGIGPQAGNDVRQRKSRRAAALRPGVSAGQLRRHHRELGLAGVGSVHSQPLSRNL
jgi:hypothetical protein